MRVAVANQHWATAGGGETYALAIAKALAVEHDVSLLSPPEVDWSVLTDRLQVDIGSLGVDPVDFADGVALTRTARRYDLFVNTSFATEFPCPIERGILVVHFPFRLDRGLSRFQRAALRAGLRLGVQPPSEGVSYLSGFHLPERTDSEIFRWTTGQGVLEVSIPDARPAQVTVTFGSNHPVPTPVEVSSGGQVLARATVPAHAPSSITFPAERGSTDTPLSLTVTSPTFVPHEVIGTADYRTLGVQITGVIVRRALLHRIARRSPVLQRLRWARFLRTYDAIVANSTFTQGWIRRWWGAKAHVIHPAIEPKRRSEKDRMILSVGRFFGSHRGHSKRQLEMVEAFRRLHEDGAPDWEFHLVGGCQPEDEEYLRTVQTAAEGLPVHFHVGASKAELDDLYARASVYWHATGLGIDLEATPEQMEHFGIAVVEAMSAGAVPVVFAGGGPQDIVRDAVDGFHFTTVEGLVERTREVVSDDPLRARLSRSATGRALDFAPASLKAQLDALVDRISSGPTRPGVAPPGPA